MRSATTMFAALAVAGCSTSTPIIIPDRPPAAPAPTASSGPLAGGGFRPPDIQRESGLGAVIGARAEQLTMRFGAARIDLSEGDARKLQFASDACVLDVFLYPLEPGQAPIATHVEARRPQDGSGIDRGECIALLARRKHSDLKGNGNLSICMA